MKLYLATGNAGKVRDFRGMGLPGELFPGFSSLPAVDENGASFEANARLKAEHYSHFTEDWVMADDSGLEVEALGGEPGIYSARFAGRHGDDAANNQLLLDRLAGVARERRQARFVCVLALAQRGTTAAVFRGAAEGVILSAPRGGMGFGYDPLFFSLAADATFAELQPERKAEFSHRGQAARGLLQWLRAHPR
jgi:XTP/dITP diphosphohydrolase